jgi:hypothetical protein
MNSRNILKEFVYQQTGDIALVLYAIVSGDGSPQLNTTKIPKSIFEEWGKPLEEVWDAAMNNTMVLAPPRLYHSFIDVAHPTYEKGIFMTEDGGNNSLTSRLNMITTTKQVNGAIALFYPGVLEKLSEIAGGNFYVSFTSMHEAHIHPYGSIKQSTIQQTLLDTNRHFPGDMLTQKVFFYDARRKIFYAK